MKRALGSASPKLRSAATAAAFATLYFLTASLTDSLIGDTGIAVLWPASGVYLGVMLLAPHRMWPLFAGAAGVGSLAAYLNGGSSFEVSLAFAVPSSAEGLLGALLVERIARKRFRLDRLHDLFALVLGGAVVANGLVALSAGAVAAQTFDASFGESWLRWWSADALGMLAVAPIVTAPLRTGERGLARLWSPGRVAALGGLGAGIVAMQLVSHGSDLVGGGGDAGDQIYMVQAFLAALLLGSLALAASVKERAELRERLGNADAELDGSTEELDGARRRIAQLNAELAGRRAELVQAERRGERLAAELRESEAERRRTDHKLADATSALAASRRERDELFRDLGLTTTDRDRVQSELDASTRAAERLRAELSGAADQLARARSDSRAHREELERTRAESRALQSDLERAQAHGVALEKQMEGLRADSRGLTEQLEQARAQNQALAGELDHGRASSAALQEELEAARAERASGAAELAEALDGRRRAEEELAEAIDARRSADDELAEALDGRRRAEDELAEALDGRRRAEDEMAAVAGRVEALERELERSRRAHRDAELALEHARARFNERLGRLERSRDQSGSGDVARPRATEPAGSLSARYDERGTCLSASAGFASLLGYDPRELVGRPGAELLHPEDLPRLARARAARSRSSFEARLRRKAGDFVLVEVTLDPVWSSPYGKLVELTTTVRELAAGRAAA
jgi:PAS domain S-box-containing protein